MNSGIRTVDGDYVWLFQDPTHANVVIGVIGTSDPPPSPSRPGRSPSRLGWQPVRRRHAARNVMIAIAAHQVKVGGGQNRERDAAVSQKLSDNVVQFFRWK